MLAGDIDASWAGFGRFAHWPVPVLFVAGNHEFDGRELDDAWPALRAEARRLGWTLLERQSTVLTDRLGQPRALRRHHPLVRLQSLRPCSGRPLP